MLQPGPAQAVSHLQVDAGARRLRASSVGELVLDIVLIELDEPLTCRLLACCQMMSAGARHRATVGHQKRLFT